jgi:hypothetical protein
VVIATFLCDKTIVAELDQGGGIHACSSREDRSLQNQQGPLYAACLNELSNCVVLQIFVQGGSP